jgi:tRNA wybutosine-synthesizing protein 2
MNIEPFDKIKELLSKEIPSNLINKLVYKWEKVGNILTIKLPYDFEGYEGVIGKKYAEVLNCKTVLNELGGIKGELRKPNVKIIYGSKNTETIHKENKIRFKLDPQKIMFSSGNMDERSRMSTISNNSETIVDLFAGIGYFTLPIAVYSKPKKIYAIEKNPVSYNYLCQNISLNNVIDIVEPMKGDNRKVAPENVADRVIMGYIGNTKKFLPTAIKCLKNEIGIIHFHDKYPDKNFFDKAMKQISRIIGKNNRIPKILNYKLVKSYAPGINHYVFDIGVEKNEISNLSCK